MRPRSCQYQSYAKFGQIPSIRSQDIERKQNRNHRPENSIPLLGGRGGVGGGWTLKFLFVNRFSNFCGTVRTK